MKNLKNKNFLIFGGTGSFGNAVVKKLLSLNVSKIRVFSRDEKKQHDMRLALNDERLEFVIGDVRNFETVLDSMTNIDYIFFAAALKQVPSCEFYPMEALRTNVLGAENVIRSAIQKEIKKCIFLSTDKAVYPINSMGLTKALMEKVMIARSRMNNKTIFCGTRYGNVMGSRGSVIPLFINQIKSNKDVTITNSNMTRFMMSLDEAVDLVEYAFKNGNQGDLFVQKSPSATIEVLAQSLIQIFDSKSKIKNIGIRHGEKMYETLVTKEEMMKASDLGNYFKIKSDTRGLNYEKYFSDGNNSKTLYDEYNSSNTKILTKEELIQILLKLPEVKSHIN